ncbi:hypothetical protein FHG87_021629, partial [Trinorchestia longiramus]
TQQVPSQVPAPSDVSGQRPESNTTDYGADLSSVDQSSVGASPLHTGIPRPDADGVLTGDPSLNRAAVSLDKTDTNVDPVIARTRALRQYTFFTLNVELKRGEDLVPRDACETNNMSSLGGQRPLDSVRVMASEEALDGRLRTLRAELSAS